MTYSERGSRVRQKPLSLNNTHRRRRLGVWIFAVGVIVLCGTAGFVIRPALSESTFTADSCVASNITMFNVTCSHSMAPCTLLMALTTNAGQLPCYYTVNDAYSRSCAFHPCGVERSLPAVNTTFSCYVSRQQRAVIMRKFYSKSAIVNALLWPLLSITLGIVVFVSALGPATPDEQKAAEDRQQARERRSRMQRRLKEDRHRVRAQQEQQRRRQQQRQQQQRQQQQQQRHQKRSSTRQTPVRQLMRAEAYRDEAREAEIAELLMIHAALVAANSPSDARPCLLHGSSNTSLPSYSNSQLEYLPMTQLPSNINRSAQTPNELV